MILCFIVWSSFCILLYICANVICIRFLLTYLLTYLQILLYALCSCYQSSTHCCITTITKISLSLLSAWLQAINVITSYYYYHYNRFTALCPGLLAWAGTRRKHPPTHLSIYYGPQRPPCSIYMLDNLSAQPLAKLQATNVLDLLCTKASLKPHQLRLCAI